MAISSTCVLEVRTSGSDSNGGGYNPSGSSPGTDWSQQNAAQVTIDGTTISATVHTTTTQITLTGYTVATTDNRNLVQITGGTATAGVYEITAVDTANNRWTLDRAAGTAAQTVIGAMGGALASPGKAAGLKVAGNTIWIGAGTYTIGTGTANTAGKKVDDSTRGYWIGYDATRGDGTGTRPILRAGGASITLLQPAVAGSTAENIAFDNPSAFAGVTGCRTGATDILIRGCSASGLSVGFDGGTTGARFEWCYTTGCATGINPNSSAIVADCVVIGGTTGIQFSAGPVTLNRCVVSGPSGKGIQQLGGSLLVRDCIVRGCGSDGISLASFASAYNCLSYGNTGVGFIATTTPATRAVQLYNCAAGANSAATSGLTGGVISGLIALTASPFTNAAGLDFTLNNTAGGGALLRAAGWPATLPGLTGTSYPDIGAYQHADPVAAAGLPRSRIFTGY